MTTTVTATSTATTTATDTYVEDCHIILQETFETNPGYDNEGWVENGNPDPDTSPPLGVTGWGSECLYMIHDQSTHINFPSSDKIYLRFEYFIADDVNISETSIYILDNIDDFNNIFSLHIWRNDGHPVQGEFVLLNGCDEGASGLDDFDYILDTKYIVEVFYDNNDGSWEWKLDGLSIGDGTDPEWTGTTVASCIFIATSNNVVGIYFDNIDIRAEPPAGW